MEDTKTNKTLIKNRILRFLIYIIVGFVCAYIYKQFKN